MPPEHAARIGSCRILLLGTIPGYAPDAGRVAEAFHHHDPDTVGLGIPPEDLEGLAMLASDPDLELPDLDPQAERLMELLESWGPTQVPSPDLDTAYHLANENQVPLLALDMDDATHSHIYVKKVGFFQAIRSGKHMRKVLTRDFSHVDDPYDLAIAWDAYQIQAKRVAEVERLREAYMARRIREAAAHSQRLLCVLPVPRFAGVVTALSTASDPTAS